MSSTIESQEDKVVNKPSRKPRVNSEGQKQLQAMQKKFDEFEEKIKTLTDARDLSAKPETEQQTKLSSKEIENSRTIQLKPNKTLFAVDPKTGKAQSFNEKFREEYNFAKENVQFIAENKELQGDLIEAWTKPYPGVPAEFWIIPVNKPVWGPRYLAEQIKKCFYHRMVMDEKKAAANDSWGQWTGAPMFDTIIQRLDAVPVENKKKSVFMGKSN